LPGSPAHRLTEDERQAFNRDGYLILEDVLTEEEVERLTGVVDRLHAAGEFEEGRTDKTISGRVTKIGFVGMDRSLFDLVACERMLPKVWAISGWFQAATLETSLNGRRVAWGSRRGRSR